MVEFRDVVKSFGPTVVLDGLNLDLNANEVTVIIGPSGSGKSTLLRCINVLEKINGGDLIVDGLSVLGNRKQVREIRQEAGMVFQQFNLFPTMTALENVAFGMRRVRKTPRHQAQEEALDLLNKVGLAERAQHYPNELSGGQQQRVAIARALAIKPKLMLFDEPTSALDPELRHEVLRVMQDLGEEGMTMIVVTHEMDFAKRMANRIIFMDNGKIAADGSPDELINQTNNERLRSFLQHVE
ncbi:MAG TPA: glutamine ABC transporter ATP-binding protein GlnQ [Paenalcaligenes sp.]|nr:glutamine ABC transporter ATP-binding protein GlnQ [Paenalcaligenes sp.]